jgi:hypothetical protein
MALLDPYPIIRNLVFRRERILFFLLPVFGNLLCGCVSQDTGVAAVSQSRIAMSVPPTVVAVSIPWPVLQEVPAKLEKARHEVRRKPVEKASIDPGRLIGLGPDQVRGMLGTPSRVEAENPAQAWVYTVRDCSFRVFFYPDLKASFRALKFTGNGKDGVPLNSSNACIRNILTVRYNVAD